jgi:enamine deaminase RidA (YjgF/YER057c/UK114 family)
MSDAAELREIAASNARAEFAPRKARIFISGAWTWDGDGASTDPGDQYNEAMEALADAVRAAGDELDDVTLIGVEVSG